MYENNSILPTTYIHHEKQVLSMRDECQYIQQDSEKQAKGSENSVSKGRPAFNCKAWVKNKKPGRNGLYIIKSKEGNVVSFFVSSWQWHGTQWHSWLTGHKQKEQCWGACSPGRKDGEVTNLPSLAVSELRNGSWSMKTAPRAVYHWQHTRA